MSFRRVPFQFTSTDPVERHSQLMRRFGVPTEGDMLVETPSSPHLDSFYGQSSPRLQHRIPQCLAEGREPTSNENCAENVDSKNHTPKVRIIPIQIEGATAADSSNRQRTRSGGSVQNSHLTSEDRTKSNSNCSLPSVSQHVRNAQSREKVFPMSNQAGQTDVDTSKPKVFNIPVFIEGRDGKVARKKEDNTVNIPVQKVASDLHKKQNGPCISKSVGKQANNSQNKQKTKVQVSMDLISAVLKELDSYKEAVQSFTGVQGDRQYRYLDEMLTRCMLKLDDVETHGNEEIRKARKAAVKEVEKYVCMLDSKIKVVSDVPMTEENIGSGIAEEDQHMKAVQSDKEAMEIETEGEDLIESNEVTTVVEMAGDKTSCEGKAGEESEPTRMDCEISTLECVEDCNGKKEGTECLESKPHDRDASCEVEPTTEKLPSDDLTIVDKKVGNESESNKLKEEIEVESITNIQETAKCETLAHVETIEMPKSQNGEGSKACEQESDKL